MKIILLHGDDSLKAKERLNSLLKEYRKKGFSVLHISSEGKRNVAEQVSAKGLFEKEILFLLENAQKMPLDTWKWLASQDNLGSSLIILHEGFVGERIRALLPKEVQMEEFKLPRLIFSFLNSFYPGNSVKTAQILHQLISVEPTEKIVHLLGKHLRDLYWLGNDSSVLPYKEDWRILRSISQAKKFKNGQLKQTIHDLAEADVISKTSDTPMAGLLDQIIASRLE